MSFDIFWDKLDQDLANKVQDLLNEYFSNSDNKPSFIGDIEISDFSFGTIPPSIEIVNVTDLFPEFYLPDNEIVEVEYRYANDSFESSSSNMNVDRYAHLTDDTSIQSDELTDESEVSLKQDTDAQMHVNINYKGDIRMTITTELHMNYPSMMFMSLPIRLTVTGFEFSATAVIASLRNRINFCFLAPNDPEESLLKEVNIESEIGDKEKQVLKNVEKLERFIVDQLRKLIDDDLVFPSYYSIEL